MIVELTAADLGPEHIGRPVRIDEPPREARRDGLDIGNTMVVVGVLRAVLHKVTGYATGMVEVVIEDHCKSLRFAFDAKVKVDMSNYRLSDISARLIEGEHS